MKLAKAGYYNGDPGAVLMARVDHVLAVIEMEKFQNDYEAAFRELNKD